MAKNSLDKLSLSFVSIIFGGLLSKISFLNSNNNTLGSFEIFVGICCLVYFAFVLYYNYNQTRQLMEYEEELYNLAANISKEEKENKTK